MHAREPMSASAGEDKLAKTSFNVVHAHEVADADMGADVHTGIGQGGGLNLRVQNP